MLGSNPSMYLPFGHINKGVRYKMKQNETPKSLTHLRVHGQDGFILCMDFDIKPKDVINHLLKLKTGEV